MDEEKKEREPVMEYVPDAIKEGDSFIMRDAGGPIVQVESVEERSNGQGSKKKKRTGTSQLIAIILIVVLAAGCGFGGGVAAMYFAPDWFGMQGGSGGSSITIKPNAEMDTAEAIAVKALPSVVGISTKTIEEIHSPYADLFGFGGTGQNQIVQGVGTGFIVDENGYILTNSHVISDGKAETISVQLYDGRELEGKVLWNDSTLDLAIVKIEAKDLTVAELGDSDEVNIGAYAVAIGNPLGMNFQRTLTQGVISGLNRSIQVSSGMSSAGTTMEGLMQTDASINSGNSGGPLLNRKGQVIGINSAKAASGEGLGFAIPINTAKPIVDEIKTKGEFTRAYIGIEGVSLDDLQNYNSNVDVKEELGTDTGIYVANITANGGAEKAGLQKGDTIVQVNGEDVASMSGLTNKLIQYRPGDKIKITYLRDKKSHEVELTLSAGSAS